MIKQLSQKLGFSLEEIFEELNDRHTKLTNRLDEIETQLTDLTERLEVFRRETTWKITVNTEESVLAAGIII